jgi:cytochrome c-type biogenesis protein CcmF
VQDLAIIVGHYSLLLCLLASGWAVASALLGVVTRARGLQLSAERAIWVSASLTGLATICLLAGFLGNDFRLDYVHSYSSVAQPLAYKIGALWGGQAGSLLLWVLFLTVMAAIMVRTNREKNRALMPYATAVVGFTILFFMILLNFVEHPFATGPARADGIGLNPQLKNYWMMIHPPTLYLGYVGFTIPFGFCMAALITRRTGDLWFRTTRRWTIFSWFFLGTGILLGSYWAYIELGWGGYWAWDPVENASLMPWLTGTAFLHSVMVQEKKNMLKVWNVLLIILTFSLSIFGTFLTRSGVISSVHAFATSQIGPAFGIFLGLIFFGALVLLISRLDDLRSDARLESVLSRESTFLFNNMVLVGIAATVLLLTTFPMLSEAVTGRKVTMGPPIFNLVNIPWALVLLVLMGIGPLIAWRKAGRDNLRRNFLWPSLAGLWLFLLLVIANMRPLWGATRTGFDRLLALDVAGVLDQVKHFYPALTFGIGAFVLGTMVLEFYRGTRVRVVNHGESVGTALGRLIWRNKRYRLEAVDDHLGAVTELSIWGRADGAALGHVEAEQRFHPMMMVPELREAFNRAKALGESNSPDYPEAILATYQLIPMLEQHYRREVKTPSTEVGIHKTLSPLRVAHLGEDLYVIPLAVDHRTGAANFRVFINPMVNFIWLGGVVFVLGAVIALLPDSRERRRIQAALDLEERAVA